VRVLPDHPLLDSRAELGLVTYPQAPAGMTNGDLRLPGGARGVVPPWLYGFDPWASSCTWKSRTASARSG
jgi:hypothetical protein